MKKAIALFLALVMVFALCACGKSEAVVSVEKMINTIGEVSLEKEEGIIAVENVYNDLSDDEKSNVENYSILVDARSQLDTLLLEAAEAAKVELGETVKTDIMQCTLKEACFCYYASALGTTFAEPLEDPDGGIFTVAKGNTFVVYTFDISNLDRSSLNFGNSMSNDACSIGWSVIYNGNTYPMKAFDLNDRDGSVWGNSLSYSAVSSGGKAFQKLGTTNVIIDPGKKLTIRNISQVNFEPSSLGDTFEIEIPLLNSKGEYEHFIYKVS